MRAIALLALMAGAVAVAAAGSPHHRHVRAPPVPSFPLDWTANEEDFMVVYQGDYTVSGTNYCCGDSSCEVQTQYQSGMNYFDYTHNRTRFDDPVNGNIVSLFAPTYKEILVDANNVCQAYCPIEEDLEPYGLDPNSTYMGQKSINGKMYDDWQFKDIEFGIVFETSDVFVDPSSQLPFEEIDQITPFGQNLGLETSTYHTFVPGTPDPSHFAVKNVDACPESSNCGEDVRQHVRRRLRMWKTWMRYATQNAMEKNEMLARKMQRLHK